MAGTVSAVLLRMLDNTKPMGHTIYSCCECGTSLSGKKTLDCADCGGLFCEACVRNGSMGSHICEDDYE